LRGPGGHAQRLHRGRKRHSRQRHGDEPTGRVRGRRRHGPCLSPGRHLGRQRLHGRARRREISRIERTLRLAGSRSAIRTRIHASIADISAKRWNALSGTDIPFLRHEYFHALEASGSLGAASGWTPCYLTLEDEAGALLGAVPLFEKSDSRGEFIFDWGWAAAMRRAGRPYYPKLVAAIPYTPVPGPRCLVASGTDIETKRKLIKAALALAEDRHCSSLHWLFIPESSLQ